MEPTRDGEATEDRDSGGLIPLGISVTANRGELLSLERGRLLSMVTRGEESSLSPNLSLEGGSG